jgi:hypothetical protein
MAFLLVMIVDGTQVPGDYHFRSVFRCNQFAVWLETGAIKPVDKRRLNTQKNISAYCIPVKVRPNITFYD